uniref:Uncharacterized protein n=1 Tax=Rhizophora mucronata TaxID=61149 RepID=A0A2P2NAZ8_RHIMU
MQKAPEYTRNWTHQCSYVC